MRTFTTNLMCVFLFLFITSGVCLGISAKELRNLMQQDEQTTVIDIRHNSSYKEGHIPGAINIPARLCPMKKLPALGRVVVYGDGLDQGPAIEAANALNDKKGIRAEILDGGFSAWEAVSYHSTQLKGMERENIRYISYQQLKTVIENNPDAVLIDLRNASSEKKELADLTTEFPGVRIITAPYKGDQKTRHTGLLNAGVTKHKGGTRGDFYILIDNGNGAAEKTAERLRESGIKRVAVLMGGEQTIIRKGQYEQKKNINRVRQIGISNEQN